MFKQVLTLLALQFNQPQVRNLAELMSAEEWKAKQLAKETMTSLGLKGSPKLSKILVGMGIPTRRVELILNGTKKEATTKIYYHDSENEEFTQESEWFVWHQTSTHFESCQYDGSSYDKREWDKEDFDSFMLYFWVAGGRELKARAKVRLLATLGDDDHLTINDGFYLYVERPYGNSSLLMDDFNTLIQFGMDIEAGVDYRYPFKGILMPPVWDRPNGMNPDFQSQYGGLWKGPDLYNLASSGYQDTLTNGQGPYNCFVSVYGPESPSLSHQAYKGRPKQGNVYLQSLQSVEWNAQKGLVFKKQDDPRINPTRPANGAKDHSHTIHRMVKAGLKIESHVEYQGRRHRIRASRLIWDLNARGSIKASDECIEYTLLNDVVKMRVYLNDTSRGYKVAESISPIYRVSATECLLSIYASGSGWLSRNIVTGKQIGRAHV